MLRVLANAMNCACRGIPVQSGLTRLAHSRVGEFLCHNSRPRFVRLRYGGELFVDPNEYVGRVVTLCGEYDPKIGSVCRRVLRKGDCLLDIGAHCGLESMICAGAVGPSGHVHSFEPQRGLAEMLRRSIERNSLSNITLHEVALSDRDGEATLHIPANNRSAAHIEIGAASPDRPGQDVTVRSVAAASYLRELKLPPLRLIKIDVEGHEATVLRSAVPILRMNPPAVILFESHQRQGAFFDREEVQILAELGYEFFQILKSLFSLALRPLCPGSPLAENGYDFVAILRGEAGNEARHALGCRESASVVVKGGMLMRENRAGRGT